MKLIFINKTEQSKSKTNKNNGSKTLVMRQPLLLSVFALITIPISTIAYSMPNDFSPSCTAAVAPFNPTTTQFTVDDGTDGVALRFDDTGGLSSFLPDGNEFCVTNNEPDLDDSNCEQSLYTDTSSVPFTATSGVPFFINVTLPTGQCIATATFNSPGPTSSISLINSRRSMTSEPVPIFTPIGLVAIVSGLLWFGRRRKSTELI